MATIRSAPARRGRCQGEEEEGSPTRTMNKAHALLLTERMTNSLFLQEIEAFMEMARGLGQETQAFVADLCCLEQIGRITRHQDEFNFEFNTSRLEDLHGRRRLLLKRLFGCESMGVNLRVRLRDPNGFGGIVSDGSSDNENNSEYINSLDLPVDRSTQIIRVEQYILQLAETRSKLRTYWTRYLRGLRNLKTLDEFENRFRKVSLPS